MKYILVAALAFFPAARLSSYPIDGYELTQIRRLARLQKVVSGELKEKLPVSGMLWTSDQIKLQLRNAKGDSLTGLPATTPEFQKSINALFPGLNESYAIAVLDITPGRPTRYAQRNESRGYQPGSVGKLAVLLGLFTELATIYPESFSDRQTLLCHKRVKGGQWALTDSHTVPNYNPATGEFVKRKVAAADVFSLYEWADHAISVSNNGAASVLWREVVLMRAFGKAYAELTDEQSEAFFKQTPKDSLAQLANAVVNEPLRTLGITSDEWRLGKFFTHGASQYIAGVGGSIGTTAGLMKFLIAMERGIAVDSASSLEMKKLMYQTDRRIRYATSPALNEAAVYFKSGSLYKCKEEEGFTCKKYMGNVENYMNSVCIVEQPTGEKYLVCLMSNVLRRNSNNDHQSLAGKIDKVVRGG